MVFVRRSRPPTVSKQGAEAGCILRGVGLNNQGIRLKVLQGQAKGSEGAVRPLAEKLFRQQQGLARAPDVRLRLELESEFVEWFPARLLHILDNLIANSIKFRDPAKEESWVHLRLRVSSEGYEFRVSDNGVGLPAGEGEQVLELFYRSAPARAAGLGVGLAAVKLLVEQSGESLTVESREGQGSTFVVLLPRYELEDYLL